MIYNINGTEYGHDGLHQIQRPNGSWDIYRTSDDVLLDNVIMALADVEVR